jgi:uncharacterized protein (TIGR02444 family)
MRNTDDYETLWDWSLRHYAKPDVAPICLTLQDQCGDDVNFLLWVCWNADRGHVPSTPVIAKALTICSTWQKAGIAAIRKQRRALRPDLSGVLSPHDQELKSTLLKRELTLEQQQQSELEMLDTMPQDGPATNLASETLAKYRHQFLAADEPREKLTEQLVHAIFSA